MVSGMLSLFSNCLEKTLEAIAFFDLWFEAVRSVDANGMLLLEDQICELLQLGFHPLELGNIILDAPLRELVLLINWLQRLRVGVGGDLVGNGEVCLDIHDLHRPCLSKQYGEPDVLNSLAIDKVDNELHELRVGNTIDFDAVERP
jgi:hypothetical protein